MADIGGRKQGSGSSRWAIRAAMFLSLALVAAGLAALVLTRWVNARMAAARVPTAQVVVAAVDLPVGTRVAREHLATIEWPLASRPDSAAADPAACEGKVVATRIFKGEPVLAEKLVSGKSGNGLAALLPEGARAVSVRVDDVVGVAGFIHPGDFVDVIVTMRPSESAGSFTSKIILQSIKVLAVGKEVDAAARGDKVLPATVATLQVDSLEAEKLALAASKGQLLLALRSAADGVLVETRGVAPPALLASSEPASPEPARARPARARPPPAKAIPRDKQMVEIMRGDLFERRGFENKEG
ncbi:MAG TPA: Flp pilus assembly protein CpaB, partial [Anaeromyxobacteraceae bacterium]|nr:Flp pilus assembly protein CpaB [Anaeromyxobacteraceae bacterium]